VLPSADEYQSVEKKLDAKIAQIITEMKLN
jgi:hypothetical protein